MAREHVTSVQGSVFFTKQPILDIKRSIWGYELLGGEMKDGIYEIFPQQESASGLSSSAYVGLQETMERGKRIMMGFDDASILTGVPHALPPSCGVVRVLPDTDHASGLDTALQALRSEGYQTVLEVTPGNPLPLALCSQADIFAFDLNSGRPDEASLNLMGARQAVMLARGVKSTEQFQAAGKLGFSLFQGSFFKEPEHIRDRKLASNVVSRLNLLRLMETGDPDVKALAEAIQTDVSISFRLLAYLNSPWFGLRQNIQTIDHAIKMLGWIKLKVWLRAVLIVDMAGRDEVPRELAGLSLQRAKFFESLATHYDYWGFNPNTLFLAGLFSLMDAILAMPMVKVVELLPLDDKLKAALKRDPNNEYRSLFRLLECMEDADWPALEVLAQKLAMDLGEVKAFYAQARDWAAGFFALPA